MRGGRVKVRRRLNLEDRGYYLADRTGSPHKLELDLACYTAPASTTLHSRMERESRGAQLVRASGSTAMLILALQHLAIGTGRAFNGSLKCAQPEGICPGMARMHVKLIDRPSARRRIDRRPDRQGHGGGRGRAPREGADNKRNQRARPQDRVDTEDKQISVSTSLPKKERKKGRKL